jgi:hypothetical protein
MAWTKSEVNQKIQEIQEQVKTCGYGGQVLVRQHTAELAGCGCFGWSDDDHIINTYFFGIINGNIEKKGEGILLPTKKYVKITADNAIEGYNVALTKGPIHITYNDLQYLNYPEGDYHIGGDRNKSLSVIVGDELEEKHLREEDDLFHLLVDGVCSATLLWR